MISLLFSVAAGLLTAAGAAVWALAVAGDLDGFESAASSASSDIRTW